MATQKCPKCKSRRIRQGYRPTSILLKVIFRYNLLCEDCNWEFQGFAIPGTVSRKTKKKKNSTTATLPNISSEYPASVKAEEKKNSAAAEDQILSVSEVEDLSKKYRVPTEIRFGETVNGILSGELAPKNKIRIKRRVRVKLH